MYIEIFEYSSEIFPPIAAALRAATIDVEYLNILLNISIFEYSRARPISCNLNILEYFSAGFAAEKYSTTENIPARTRFRIDRHSFRVFELSTCPLKWKSKLLHKEISESVDTFNT
jgi:hypothetical protein